MVTLFDWIQFAGQSTLKAVRKAQKTRKQKDIDFAKALLAFRQAQLVPKLDKYETELKKRSFDEKLENNYIALKRRLQYAREKMNRYQTLENALKNSIQTLPSVDNTRIEQIKTDYDNLSEKIAIIKENQINTTGRIKGKSSLQEAKKALEKETLDYNTIALLQHRIIALQPKMEALKKQIDKFHDARVSPLDNNYIKAKNSLELVSNKMEKYFTLWNQIQEKPFTGKDALEEIRKAQGSLTKENINFVKALLTFCRVKLQSVLEELKSKSDNFFKVMKKEDQETRPYDDNYLKLKAELLTTQEKMKKHVTLLALLKDKEQLTSEKINATDPDFAVIKKQYENYSGKTEKIKKNQSDAVKDLEDKNYLQKYKEALQEPTIEKFDNTIALLQYNIIKLQAEMDRAAEQLQGLYDAGTSEYDDSYIENKHQLDHLLEKMETYHILTDKIAAKKSQLIQAQK